MTDGRTLAPDYATARARFLAAAEAAGAALDAHVLPEVGPDGGELATDVAWLGPADADRLVLVVSGTHGVEGFAGSLCQSTWLEDHGADARPDGLALVFVHALNPYGFAWVRRVNEDNVDLNRNFADLADPPTNDGYDELAAVLSPDDLGPENEATYGHQLFAYAGEHGMDAVGAAVSGGQYRHPDGLFFGGSEPVRSHRLLHDLVLGRLRGASRVAVLDLHTGLGEWGEVEAITHVHPDSEAYARARRWWGDRVASNHGGESVSAPLAGEWMMAAEEWLGDDVEVTCAALEWGTYDSLIVLAALRADNWLHTRGDPTGPDAPAIKAQLRAAFAPDDPAWAARVLDHFDDALARTLAALA